MSRQPNREINISQTLQTAIVFEVSRTQKSYFRRVYTIFDLLADVGGLFGSVFPFFAIIVGAVQYYGPHQYVMNDVFK